MHPDLLLSSTRLDLNLRSIWARSSLLLSIICLGGSAGRSFGGTMGAAAGSSGCKWRIRSLYHDSLFSNDSTPYCIPLASRFRGTCICLHLSACSLSYDLATPDKVATKPSANGTKYGVEQPILCILICISTRKGSRIRVLSCSLENNSDWTRLLTFLLISPF